MLEVVKKWFNVGIHGKITKTYIPFVNVNSIELFWAVEGLIDIDNDHLHKKIRSHEHVIKEPGFIFMLDDLKHPFEIGSGELCNLCCVLFTISKLLISENIF